MLSDMELPWKPFGLTLTYKEWDDLVTWYIQKNMSNTLDTQEDTTYAHKLYPQKFDSWSH